MPLLQTFKFLKGPAFSFTLSRIPKRLWLQKCVSWGEGPFLCPLVTRPPNFSLDSANIFVAVGAVSLDSGNTHFPEAHLGPQGTNVWVSAQSQFQGMGWQTTRQTSMWISSLDPLHHTVTRAQMHLTPVVGITALRLGHQTHQLSLSFQLNDRKKKLTWSRPLFTLYEAVCPNLLMQHMLQKHALCQTLC